MDATDRTFLAILKNALTGEPIPLDREIGAEELNRLFHMASIHNVLPLIYEALYPALSTRKDLPFLTRARYEVRQQVVLQTWRTAEFLELNRRLQAGGVQPLVVKGIICRNLYPKPDHRLSSDEDLLISQGQFMLCSRLMVDYGMQTMQMQQIMCTDAEVSFCKEGSPLYIELHQHLFPPESDAYGDLSGFFEDVYDRAIPVEIQGETVYTLGHTDHLFYLLCHAFKHFLHSGVGIRQVCDIVLYANAHGHQIDWVRILENCRTIRAELFAAALFEIGRKYLVFDPVKAACADVWRNMSVDEEPLLEDLLSSGIYGGSSMSRKHSSNITLDTVAAQKWGRKAKNAVAASVFPQVSQLERRYPYLKKHPYLVPVAWCCRLWTFARENINRPSSNAAEALKIGSDRIELMKKYGIIQ